MKLLNEFLASSHLMYIDANIHWDGWFSQQRVPRFYTHFGGSFIHIVKKLASIEASLYVSSVLIL